MNDKGGFAAFSTMIERRGDKEGTPVSRERADAFYEKLVAVASKIFNANTLGDLTTEQFNHVVNQYTKEAEGAV